MSLPDFSLFLLVSLGWRYSNITALPILLDLSRLLSGMGYWGEEEGWVEHQLVLLGEAAY